MTTRFNTLMPELYVTNLERSLHFYRDVIGFQLEYERPENRFALLTFHGSVIMLEEVADTDSPWVVSPLDYPRGRGLNFSIECPDVQLIYDRVKAAGITVRKPLEEKWHRGDNVLFGERNFLIQDPDGFLLRFMQAIGTRPV